MCFIKKKRNINSIIEFCKWAPKMALEIRPSTMHQNLLSIAIYLYLAKIFFNSFLFCKTIQYHFFQHLIILQDHLASYFPHLYDRDSPASAV